MFKVVMYLNWTYGSISVKDMLYVHLREGVLDHVDRLGVLVA